MNSVVQSTREQDFDADACSLRARLLEAVQQEPGILPKALARRLGVRFQSVYEEARTLIEGALLVCVDVRGARHYFAPGLPALAMRQLTTLRHAPSRHLYQFMQGGGELEQRALVDYARTHWKWSRTSTLNHLRRLRDGGLAMRGTAGPRLPVWSVVELHAAAQPWVR